MRTTTTAATATTTTALALATRNSARSRDDAGLRHFGSNRLSEAVNSYSLGGGDGGQEASRSRGRQKASCTDGDGASANRSGSSLSAFVGGVGRTIHFEV